MKKKLSFLIGLVAMAITPMLSNAAEVHYSISGHINGLDDGTELVLRPVSHINVPFVSETSIKDGKFEFNGVFPEQIAVKLMVKDAFGGITLFLEDSPVSVIANADKQKVPNGFYYYFSDVDIEGSPLSEKYAEVSKPRRDLDRLMNENKEQNAAMLSQRFAAQKAGDRAKLDSIENTLQWKEFEATERYCFYAFKKVLREAVQQNYDNIFAPVAMLEQLVAFDTNSKDLYNSFSDDIKNSFHGKLIAEELYPVGLPGSPMYDFNAIAINGDNLNLSEICKNKNLVLLDFWASWCRPCRGEIPNLKEIYAKYKDKGFEIISVSIDNEEDKWLNAVEKEDLKWHNVRDTDGKIASIYKVQGIPTMYLIDKDFRMVAENLRGQNLADKVSELLD